MRNSDFPYLPRDFIQTDEGLIFAVVSYQPEDNKVGCFLRYIPDGNGWQKVATEQANQLLETQYPQYLYYSEKLMAHFHAVAIENIAIHHRPEQRLHKLINQTPSDEIEIKLQKLLSILVRYGADCDFLGLTGSMLIGQQRQNSDIDLVVYGRTEFHKTRHAIKQAIADGAFSQLNETLMQENYNRRAGELDLKQFSWHEFRKYNKAVIDSTKFDIGMVLLEKELTIDSGQYTKKGTRVFTAMVMDDRNAFDLPARYQIDDEITSEILSFTHTYVGQAVVGETIEVAGAVECNDQGQCRLIVGSSREAKNEYIKVIKE